MLGQIQPSQRMEWVQNGPGDTVLPAIARKERDDKSTVGELLRHFEARELNL